MSSHALVRPRHVTTLLLFAALAVVFTFVAEQSFSSSPARSATRLSVSPRLGRTPSPGTTRHVQITHTALARYEANADKARFEQYMANVHTMKVDAFLAAVHAAQVTQYFAALQAQQQAAAASDDAGGWAAVAQCEEGGSDNPTFGYYGITEWNGYDGYATAGDAPQSVQLQWEEQNVGAPPDESGGCHGY